MRILVATTKTQGARKNDFCFVPEAEPVMFGFECDNEPIDGGCGCRRAMVGVSCLKATSTVAVAETPLDRDGLVADFVKSSKRSGFNLTAAEVAPMADDIIRIAGRFGTGAVLERRGDAFRARPAGKE